MKFFFIKISEYLILFIYFFIINIVILFFINIDYIYEKFLDFLIINIKKCLFTILNFLFFEPIQSLIIAIGFLLTCSLVIISLFKSFFYFNNNSNMIQTLGNNSKTDNEFVINNRLDINELQNSIKNIHFSLTEITKEIYEIKKIYHLIFISILVFTMLILLIAFFMGCGILLQSYLVPIENMPNLSTNNIEVIGDIKEDEIISLLKNLKIEDITVIPIKKK